MKQLTLILTVALFATTHTQAQNVGIGTTTPARSFHINSGTLLITGDTGTVPNLPSGGKFFWSPAKTAFRAGSTTGTQWDYANIGTSSFAFGKNSNASGSFTMAGGEGTTVSNTHSFASGLDLTVAGQYSSAFGNGNAINSSYSFSTGLNNIVNANYASTLGSNLQADSYNSLVIGRYNKIEGSTTTWVATDPAFVIGNGGLRGFPLAVFRNNAFSVAKNGNMEVAGTATIEGTTTLNDGLNVVGSASVSNSLSVNNSTTIADSLSVNGKVSVLNSINIKEFGALTSLHVGGGVSIKSVFSYYDDILGPTTFPVGDNSNIVLRITNGTSPLNVVLANGVTPGQVLIVSSFSNAVFNFIDNSNNLKLGGNRTLNNSNDRLGLMWNGGFWIELFFSNND